MEAKKFLVLISVCLLFPSIVLAQYQYGYVPVTERIAGWGYSILFIIILGGFLITLAFILRTFRPQWSKYLATGGLLIVLIGVFLVELAYIVPMFLKPVISYAACEATLTPMVTPVTDLPDPVVDVVTATACVFAGYVPTEWTGIGLATFFIFGIIAPFAIMIALFYEFTDFFINKSVRNVISFAAAMIAFRFLLATMFIEMLSYGFAGLGLLLIDYFIFAVFFRFIRKFWEAYSFVHDTMRIAFVEDVSQIESRLRVVNEMLPRTPDTDPLKKDLEEAQKLLRKRLIELGKTPL